MTNTLLENESISQCEIISGKAELDQLLTIRQFCKVFPWPSESALRAYIFRANDLGISDAFIRFGRRVLVDPKKFFMLIKQLHNCFAKREEHDSNESNKRRNNY